MTAAASFCHVLGRVLKCGRDGRPARRIPARFHTYARISDLQVRLFHAGDHARFLLWVHIHGVCGWHPTSTPSQHVRLEAESQQHTFKINALVSSQILPAISRMLDDL